MWSEVSWSVCCGARRGYRLLSHVKTPPFHAKHWHHGRGDSCEALAPPQRTGRKITQQWHPTQDEAFQKPLFQTWGMFLGMVGERGSMSAFRRLRIQEARTSPLYRPVHCSFNACIPN